MNGSNRTNQMLALRTQEKLTLQEIAEQFGISRQRVRQIIGDTGHIIDRDIEPGSPADKGEIAERKISILLADMGIENTLMPTGYSYDILVQGHTRVDVKSANPLTHPKNPRTIHPQYEFQVRDAHKRQDVDFYVLLTADTNDAFIVPVDKVPGSQTHIIFCWPGPRQHSSGSNWQQYHNRWDLITG
jgi:hypothetical protein